MIAALVYPHQLWESNPAVIGSRIVVFWLKIRYFLQYNFHAQKLLLHRASMTEFSAYCHRLGKQVHRIETHQLVDTCEIGAILKNLKISQALGIDPTDVWLKERVDHGCRTAKVAIQWLEDPSVLNSYESDAKLGGKSTTFPIYRFLSRTTETTRFVTYFSKASHWAENGRLTLRIARDCPETSLCLRFLGPQLGRASWKPNNMLPRISPNAIGRGKNL